MAGIMKINQTTDFGNIIRAKRKHLGLTQTELAGYCGCSINFLSQLERGKPTAEIGKSIMVINTLGIDLMAQDREKDIQ